MEVCQASDSGVSTYRDIQMAGQAVGVGINSQSRQTVENVAAVSNESGFDIHSAGMVVGTESRSRQFAEHMAVFNNEAGVKESGNSIDDGLFYPVKQPIGSALLLGNDRVYPGDDEVLKVSMDLDLMRGALNDCGWSVSNPYPDQGYLGSMQFDQTLRDISSSDYSQSSCFMFYYSGHGNEEGLLLSDSHRRSYTDIITTVSANNSLEGKPKIFIFDSCRTRKELSFINKYLHMEIRKIHDPQALPPDTLVCYSATDGMQSYSRDDVGSFYTKELVKFLREFWDRMTFTEIVTLTHGWARQMARQNAKEQQPVMYCSLNYLLLLCERKEREELGGRQRVFHVPSNQGYQGSQIDDKSQCVFNTYNIRTKGPRTPGVPDNQGSEVDKDAVRGGQVPPVELKTKQDVLNNLPRLGQGMSVFVCYAPDPESPYNDPKAREDVIDFYQEAIAYLIRDLERHGFTIISDLHLGDTQPKNWLQWYVSRIELCDYLIMVCSPAFKELFSCEKPQAPVIDEHASWFLAYRSVMYAEIAKEVSDSPEGSKYVPVILGDWTSDEAVPTLFAMAQKYRLGFVDEPRGFDYDTKGGFESLVCRMAGINREELAKPVDKGVHQLAPAYSQAQGAFRLGTHQVVPTKPRRGYQGIPFVPSSAATPPASGPVSHPAQLPQSARPQPTFTPHPQPLAPRPLPPVQLPPPTQPPPPSSLPDKPPAHSVVLWLSQKITNWKFFARYLNMDGAEIERIGIDYRDDGVVNQRFQMFESWKRHEWRPYTYRTLGDVLVNNASNAGLYTEFCQKVTSAEQA